MKRFSLFLVTSLARSSPIFLYMIPKETILFVFFGKVPWQKSSECAAESVLRLIYC